MWFFTVFSEMPRRRPICLFVRPSAANCSTSSSRPVMFGRDAFSSARFEMAANSDTSLDATAGDRSECPSWICRSACAISDEEADLYDAIKAGATGYLLKEVSIEEVGSAIRSVQGGQSLISPSMASKLLSEFATMVKRADEKQSVPQPRLTDREMEVLKLVAKGRNNRDIAKELFISENTVKNHIRNILEKLHLHSRMEAVVYAVREKLLEIK